MRLALSPTQRQAHPAFCQRFKTRKGESVLEHQCLTWTGVRSIAGLRFAVFGFQPLVSLQAQSEMKMKANSGRQPIPKVTNVVRQVVNKLANNLLIYIESESCLFLAPDWSFVGCGRQAPPTVWRAVALRSSVRRQLPTGGGRRESFCAGRRGEGRGAVGWQAEAGVQSSTGNPKLFDM